jgi:hypothetical protein
MYGSWLVLLLIALYAGVFGVVFSDLSLFFTGHYTEIPTGKGYSLLVILPFLFAVVVLDVPIAISSSLGVQAWYGKTKSHAMRKVFLDMKEGNHFFTFFIAVLLEEMFARLLFVGWLPKLLPGPVMFYILMILGNALWALIHLVNFKNQADKKILRVLPQFLGGFFLAYVFVKFGFFAAVLAHFAFNAVLFASHKTQRINAIDGYIIGYMVLCTLVSYALMEKPIGDVVLWFSVNPTFTIPGWEFWDYLKVSVFISGTLFTVLGVLCYDRNEAALNKKEKQHGVIETILALPIVLLLCYVLFLFLGLFIYDVQYRILTIAVVMCSMLTSSSGSAMSRMFWLSVPDVYLTVCLMLALGFWPGCLLLCAEAVIHTPRLILNRYDD